MVILLIDGTYNIKYREPPLVESLIPYGTHYMNSYKNE